MNSFISKVQVVDIDYGDCYSIILKVDGALINAVYIEEEDTYKFWFKGMSLLLSGTPLSIVSWTIRQALVDYKESRKIDKKVYKFAF